MKTETMTRLSGLLTAMSLTVFLVGCGGGEGSELPYSTTPAVIDTPIAVNPPDNTTPDVPTTPIISGGTHGADSPVIKTILFQDGFESGNKSHSENGISWGGSNAGKGDSVSVSTEFPGTGSYSLKLKYGAGPDGDDAWAEQRFELGNRYSEILIKYDLYVPGNYYHRRQSTSANNKSFVHVWAGDYNQGPGFGGGFEIWPDGNGLGTLKFHSFRPDQTHKADPITNTKGIEFDDIGQWIEITIQIVMATPANNDGIMRVWKKTYSGVTEKIFELTNLPIYNSSGNYFERGYLFGWSNSGYDLDTTFYIDNVVIGLP